MNNISNFEILDIGAESTRPGAKQIPYEIELERILPLIDLLKENKFFSGRNIFSIDTRKV